MPVIKNAFYHVDQILENVMMQFEQMNFYLEYMKQSLNKNLPV